MAKIQTNCPNCNQPLVADIEQVIDVAENPQLKDLLLAGGLNVARCQICGFQGQLPVPLVYHDREKELLLTFTPPSPGKTMEQKESALAPLLRKVTDSLKPEDRKGYLFQPQAMLTMANLVKNVLLADGITEEMLEEQQEQIKLLDQLFTLEGEGLKKVITENKDKITREFFGLFAEIAQRIIASQDKESITKIQNIQDALMEETEIGKEIKSEAEQIRAATESLEALGKNLTRDSLLELVIKAPSIERVKALGSIVGQAMDYEFFQRFTDKIEAADQKDRKELVERRNLLLKISEEIRKEIEKRMSAAREQIEKILDSPSLEEGLRKNLTTVDQVFLETLSGELKQAQEKGDQKRVEKLGELFQLLQRLTTPPELKTVESLLDVVNEKDELNRKIEEIEPEMLQRVNDYLVSVITNYEQQADAGDDQPSDEEQQALQDLKSVYSEILKKSMQSKMNS